MINQSMYEKFATDLDKHQLFNTKFDICFRDKIAICLSRNGTSGIRNVYKQYDNESNSKEQK